MAGKGIKGKDEEDEEGRMKDGNGNGTRRGGRSLDVVGRQLNKGKHKHKHLVQ